MKTIVHALFAIFLTISISKAGTNEPVKNENAIVTIAGEPISQEEFIKMLKKNNNKTQFTQQEIEEYLELFINFKLKVKAAEQAKLDTTAKFKMEFENYRKQLVSSYLVDKATEEKLIQEAYERLQWNINADHILIKVDPNAMPEDTLKAFKKITEIRNNIVSGKASFEEQALQYSEDPSVKINKGNLGYFSAFDMVYPFETAAFNTSKGQISQPFRTRFGYHIVKVNDKVKGFYEYKIAHIFLKKEKTDTSTLAQNLQKTKIENIYKELQAGKSFTELMKQYSNDKNGELPFVTRKKLVPEIENEVFKLQKGAYSQPIQTNFGWHIITLIDTKEIPDFSVIKGEIKRKVNNSDRQQASQAALVNQIKKEYQFVEDAKYPKTIKKIIDKKNNIWSKDLVKKVEKKQLFKLNGNYYTMNDFVKYIEAEEPYNYKYSYNELVNEVYPKFVAATCIAYEEAQLEKKYPDFKFLIQEYREGILLFDMTEKMIWKKATDSLGLKEFYNKNRMNYLSPRTIQADIYKTTNEKTAQEIRKLLAQPNKQKTTNNNLEAFIKKQNSTKNNVSVEQGTFEKGQNNIIDQINWVKGVSEIKKIDNSYVVINVKEINEPAPKDFDSIKGSLVNDYQTYLENQWIKELRNMYPLTVNRTLLKNIE